MGKFEENWKEVFEGTEVAPSDLVWANIDRDLANADSEAMKKRIVLYQRVAAASVLFAILAGSFGIYRWRDNDPQLAQRETLGNEVTSNENDKKIIDKENYGANSSKSVEKGGLKALNQESGAGQIKSLSATKIDLTLNKVGGNSQSSDSGTDKRNESNIKLMAIKPNQTIVGVKEFQHDHKIVAEIGEKKLFEREIGPMPELELLPIPEIKDGPVIAEIIRKLPYIPGAFMVKKENKINHEHLWASMTAATGSYNLNTNSYSSYNYSASAQVASTSSSAVIGTSYSFGILAGMRITRRVVLQSGVQYMNQSIGSVSNINSINSMSPVANYATNPSSSYNTTSPYNITSSNEFVSVPVQAGYLFVDRKIGLQLNSGVSTDFFIRNTLSDPSGQRQSYSQGAGSDSPYRSVNFAGLMSSEISYKIGSRYRVSVVPGFRYAFNPILKSSSNSGNPLAWDVGFRFRYIFK